MIRLLIADDHSIVRDGLKQLFALFDDISVVKEAANGGQVLDAVRAGGFDLILLDMTMSGISGVDLISRLNRQHPELPILVLSMHTEPGVATRAIRAGASGYLSKDCDASMLVSAIRKVVSGGKFLDPAVGVQIAYNSGQADAVNMLEQLTDREYHILGMLVRGMGVNEIAAELFLSNKTVSTHKMRMMQKLGVESNADLIKYALMHGLPEY